MADMGWLENGNTIRFERRLPGPASRVWEHLTSAEHLPVWFGGEGMEFSIEPRVGGRVHLMGGAFHGAVKEWQPGRRLVLGWNLAGVPAPETTVTFALAENGRMVDLVLTQAPLAAPFAASAMAGWHAFLDRLRAMLAGEPPGDAMAAMQRHGAAYAADLPTARPPAWAMPGPQHKIELELTLPVPPAEAYAAWTEIERLRRWFGDKVEADPRIGGRYRAENRAGEAVYVHAGEYLALQTGRLVRMSFGVPNAPATGHTFSDEFIEARFEAAPGGTLMRFTNGWNGDPIGADGEAAVREAWTQWLGKLAKSLAGEKGEHR